MLTQKIAFAATSPFQRDLKQRVDAYFEKTGFSRGANAGQYAKVAFWIVYTVGMWAVLLTNVAPFPVTLLLWLMVGFGLAGVGMNIGHDAIHGSTSEKAWVNGLLSWSFDVMGASSVTWRTAHNVLHHTYTNVPTIDDDIEPGPTLRFYPHDEPPRLYHRLQHIYAWGLYCLVGLLWVFHKDFMLILRKQPLTDKRAPLRDFAQVIAGKLMHGLFFVAIPLAVMHQPVWQLALGYMLMQAMGGFTLAVVFQLAHVVEGVSFPKVQGGGKMELGWADHEVITTANFGTTKLATFITGGLDHQIEHHLFPRVAHCHYPALSPIVRQCATDHGLPYTHNGTFLQAVASHARVMKKLGRGEALAPVVPITSQHVAAQVLSAAS